MNEAPAVLRAYETLNTEDSVSSDIIVCSQCRPGTNTFTSCASQYKGSCHRVMIPLDGQALENEGNVLCIGIEGRLKYCGDGEFMAVSYVWSHGWQGCTEDGICSRVLDMLLNAASKFGLDWIWLDIAMVSGVREIRSVTVNAMNRVYSSAAITLVCDRLLLAMNGGTAREKILAMALSDWTTRLWTMQESMLSKCLVFLQQDGYWTVEDMLRKLMDYGDEDPDNHWKLIGAMITLWIMGVDSDAHFEKMVFLSSNRRTSNPIDMSRAIFPLFKLDWPGVDTTLVDGQIILLNHLGNDACRYAWLHAPIGLPPPWTWAPLNVINAEGPILREELPMRVTPQGLEGTWFAIAVDLKEVEMSDNPQDEDSTVRYLARITGTFHDSMTFTMEDNTQFFARVYHNTKDLSIWRGKPLLLLRPPVEDRPEDVTLDYYNLVILDSSTEDEYLSMHRVGSVIAEVSPREFRRYEQRIQGVIS